MSKKIVSLRPRQKEGSRPRIPKPPKSLSLGDVTVRHTTGSHGT